MKVSEPTKRDKESLALDFLSRKMEISGKSGLGLLFPRLLFFAADNGKL